VGDCLWDDVSFHDQILNVAKSLYSESSRLSMLSQL